VALNHLFLDFNAFFASCEQHLRPELRGRPLGIVAVLAETGCCIAASYEAKAKGVKTGALVRDARQLCPDILFVEAHPAEYVRLHDQLVEIIERQMHIEAIHSIDELSCRLTGRWREPAAARALAAQIKQALRDEAGPALRCSIGIGPNVFIAKTASDMQKPDGLVIIDAPDLPGALHGLKLRDLYGIGRHLEERLHRAGITTVEQLTAAGHRQLRGVWGSVEGERYWAKLRGADVAAEPTRKSHIGHSHVLEPKFRTEPSARAVLHRLLQKAAMRLRNLQFFARELTVSIDYLGAETWAAAAHLDATQDTVELADALDTVWAQRPKVSRGVRPFLVGVTLTRLEHAADHTPSLFATAPARRAALLRATDALNKIYGSGAIYWATAHEARASAPMRIAFNRIPNMVLEMEGSQPKRRNSIKRSTTKYVSKIT
jgi:DNA polymerase-4